MARDIECHCPECENRCKHPNEECPKHREIFICDACKRETPESEINITDNGDFCDDCLCEQQPPEE